MNEDRKIEDVEASARGAADEASAKVRDRAGETIRDANDAVNETSKEGLKTAREFSETVRKFVRGTGLGELDVREIVKRAPLIAVVSHSPRGMSLPRSCDIGPSGVA